MSDGKEEHIPLDEAKPNLDLNLDLGPTASVDVDVGITETENHGSLHRSFTPRQVHVHTITHYHYPQSNPKVTY